MPNTNFVRSRRLIANFDTFDLSHSVFRYTNVKDARFYGKTLSSVDFSHANLQKTSFNNTFLIESQLQSALSIRDALLPNGTFGRDRNLIINGKGNCNSSLMKSWELKSGNVTTAMANKDNTNCYFLL